jgi:hypothetical protein
MGAPLRAAQSILARVGLQWLAALTERRQDGSDVLFGVEGVEADPETVAVGTGDDASPPELDDQLGGLRRSRDDDLAGATRDRAQPEARQFSGILPSEREAVCLHGVRVEAADQLETGARPGPGEPGRRDPVLRLSTKIASGSPSRLGTCSRSSIAWTDWLPGTSQPPPASRSTCRAKSGAATDTSTRHDNATSRLLRETVRARRARSELIVSQTISRTAP